MKNLLTTPDNMFKDAFPWQFIILWNWFSGLRCPQGVYVAFWLSKSHHFPDLPALTSRPHAHAIQQSDDRKERFKENCFSELAGSSTIQCYSHCRYIKLVKIYRDCNACAHTHAHTRLGLRAMRPILTVGSSASSGVSGHVRPTEIRLSFRGGIRLWLELEFRFADMETDLLVVSGERWLLNEQQRTLCLLLNGQL